MTTQSDTLSVSQALKLAQTSLERIAVTVVGEVSECADKPGYKAVYFTLADEQSALPCMMWKNASVQAHLSLRKGMLVEATGLFTLYAAKGRLNFEVRSIRLAGEGELRLRVAELAARLQAEGLMAPSRKLPLPSFPHTIGLVTSPRGKAVHDVLRTLRRRFPLAQIRFAGVPVEGAGASSALVAGLKAVTAAGSEVILLVRGGGSYEDLMPFNDEALARAIAASVVPVVTGIGHEPDNSIADMVSSRRASTPTAAAECVSPDIALLRVDVETLGERMQRSQLAALSRRLARIEEFGTRPILLDPRQHLTRREFALEVSQMRLDATVSGRLKRQQDLLEGLGTRLTFSGGKLLAAREGALGLWAAKLNSLSPVAVLARGYALATREDGRIVSSINTVPLNARLDVLLKDGTLVCTVEERLQKEVEDG